MESRNVQLSHVWRERLDRFSRSGLSIAEFCRRHQLSPPSFYLWRKRLAHNGLATHRKRLIEPFEFSGDSTRGG